MLKSSLVSEKGWLSFVHDFFPSTLHDFFKKHPLPHSDLDYYKYEEF